MAKSKYLKDDNGIVRAIASDSLGLEKPLTNENYDINVHNRNMNKIDEAIKQLKDDVGTVVEDVESMEFKAEKVSIADTTNVFEAATVEGALLENKTSISSLEKKIDATNVKVDAGQKHKLTGDTGFPLDISNGDANSITTCCTRSGSNIAHMPNDNKDWWTIKSDMQGDYGYQKAISWHENKTFQRWKRSNNWGDWGSL